MRVGNSCAVLVVSLPKSRKPADEGGVGGARNSTAILQEARCASFAAAPGPPCGVRSPMSMEHIVNKMWKHKMLRLGHEPIDHPLRRWIRVISRDTIITS